MKTQMHPSMIQRVEAAFIKQLYDPTFQTKVIRAYKMQASD